MNVPLDSLVQNSTAKVIFVSLLYRTPVVNMLLVFKLNFELVTHNVLIAPIYVKNIFGPRVARLVWM